MPLWLRFASATAWAGALARPDEGYLFISNRPDEAVAAALRLRAVSPEANITFVSDSASLFDIDGGRAIFDVVIAAELAMPDIRLRDSMGFRLQKLRGMTVTPYERTIYMDSDTFACRAVDELFRTLERERADVACVWGGRGNHTGASAGVLAYSRSRASRALWAAWEEIYRQVMTTSRREQPSFQKAVAVTTLKEQLRVSKLAMSYNCRNVRNCAAARLKDRTIATQG